MQKVMTRVTTSPSCTEVKCVIVCSHYGSILEGKIDTSENAKVQFMRTA